MKAKIYSVRQIEISGEFIRLDSLLKYASIVPTGGEAKALIQNGKVYVGGLPCISRGRKIRPGEAVRFGRDTLIVKQAL